MLTLTLINGDVCSNLKSVPFVTGHIFLLLRSSDPLSDHPDHAPFRVTAAVSQITTPSHIQFLVTEGDPRGSSPAGRGEASWGRNSPIAAPGTVAQVRRPCLANVGP